MALAATTIAEVWTTGSDTLNGGLFDPGQTAGMFTDLAVTSATGNSPVATSASYNFVAGDVGAHLFIGAGTNFTPGWYKIASVAANAATLNATLGQAILLGPPTIPTTVAGCATVASPTGGTWSIDYSQQAAAQIAYTDIASVGTGLTATSAAKPFAKQLVGNCIVITGGTNLNLGRYVLVSVSGVTGTFVGATNITTGAGVNGTGGMGGAWASPGAATAVLLAGFKVFIKNTATFLITSASTNVAGGCLAPVAGGAGTQVKYIGYNTYRRDGGTAPVLQASGISTFTMAAPLTGQIWENLVFDGNALTSSRGFVSGVTATGQMHHCTLKNFTNQAVNVTSNAFQIYDSIITGCSGTSPAATGASYDRVEAYSNTVSAIQATNSGSYIRNCLVYNNSGASSDGITMTAGGVVADCTIYNNGRHGVNLSHATNVMLGSGNLSYGNAGYQYTNTAAINKGTRLRNCAGDASGSGTYDSSKLTDVFGFITLTADPFVNKAGANFALNNNLGGGALCRAAGVPGAFLAGTTTAYPDVGAVQHRDLYGYPRSRIVNV